MCLTLLRINRRGWGFCRQDNGDISILDNCSRSSHGEKEGINCFQLVIILRLCITYSVYSQLMSAVRPYVVANDGLHHSLIFTGRINRKSGAKHQTSTCTLYSAPSTDTLLCNHRCA
ncbi:hypothetical protein H113_05275 [Trichophyton rubrum MR1459]|nr:hypothetical protein H113_05275 [Trichophyton rubrum MR1459]EZG05347.1 hypothetical protein H106_05076 [Trichophyton rubrum CBS 735.88]